MAEGLSLKRVVVLLTIAVDTTPPLDAVGVPLRRPDGGRVTTPGPEVRPSRGSRPSLGS